MNNRWIAGLSCGSGAEAVDAVLLDVRSRGPSVQAQVFRASRRFLPAELRYQLRHPTFASLPAIRVGLHDAFLQMIVPLCTSAGLLPGRLTAIGLLPPMLWYEPTGKTPTLLEAATASFLAQRSGITVVGGFRERDLYAGSPPVPVSTVGDALLWRDPSEDRRLIHLGGFTSVVDLPRSSGTGRVRSLETGPGNRLLDLVIEQVTGGKEWQDNGGRSAVQGRCLEPLRGELLALALPTLANPGLVSRSEFTTEFVNRAARRTGELGGTLEDLLCTLNHLVVDCVLHGVRAHLPDEPRRVLLSGGGLRNGLLRRLIQEAFPDAKTLDVGGGESGRMAAAAAGLAVACLDGGRAAGQWTPGSAANWAGVLDWQRESVAPLRYPGRAA